MFFAAILIAAFGFSSHGAEYCSSSTEPRSNASCGVCPKIKIDCDFTSLKELPRVVLVGETHNDYASHIARAQIFAKAIRGEIPVGSETTNDGPFFPWHRPKGQNTSDTRLHGIEAHQPYAVTLSYLIQNEYVLSDRPRRPEKLLNKLLDYISTIPLFRDGFTRAKGLPSLKGESPDEIRAQAAAAVPLNQVDAFARDLHLAIIALANDPNESLRCLLGNRDLRPLLKPEDRQVVGLLKPKTDNEDGNVEEILIDTAFNSYDVFRVFYSVRNREFARQATEMICRYAGKYSGIMINVGERHVSRETALWLIELTDGQVKTADILDPRKTEDAEELKNLMKQLGPIL